jgi:hypothetical protein
MNEIRVKSWNELNERLYESSWQENIKRFRSNCAFRGQNTDYKLETTLSRLGDDAPTREDHLLRAFRRYAHRDLIESDSLWYWLSMAQHHGLPTRLLDWSYSPYVAVHFATSEIEQFDQDGVIWAVDFVAASKLLPKDFRKLLEESGAQVFTVDMLDEIMAEHHIDSLTEFAKLAGQETVIFFEPPSLDERIINQFALFSLLSDPNLKFDEWLTKHPDLYRKLVIPAELKWEVRDKLDQANITERVLFPGLDGLSMWLKRYYSSAKR